MKLKPIGEKILVKVLAAEEKTKGGIIIPDTAKEERTEGEVIALGKGKVLDSGEIKPFEVKVGDKVIFGKYSGDEFTIEGKKHKILSESEIMAICE
jgi:chaperonin GroES